MATANGWLWRPCGSTNMADRHDFRLTEESRYMLFGDPAMGEKTRSLSVALLRPREGLVLVDLLLKVKGTKGCGQVVRVEDPLRAV